MLPNPVSPEDALLGFYARGRRDPALLALLGAKPNGDARMEEGTSSGTLAESAYPRLNYFSVSEVEIRAEYLYRVRIQVDIQVWPHGRNGGQSRRKAIDDRLTQLYSEKHWGYGSASLYATGQTGRSLPGASTEARIKARDFTILVSTTGEAPAVTL